MTIAPLVRPGTLLATQLTRAQSRLAYYVKMATLCITAYVLPNALVLDILLEKASANCVMGLAANAMGPDHSIVQHVLASSI
jgi:hypothetical protein